MVSLPVIAIQPLPGSNPQTTRTVGVYRRNTIGNQSVSLQVIAFNLICVQIYPVQSIAGSHPEKTFLIFGNGGDGVIRQALLISVFPMIDFIFFSIKTVQSVLGGKPQISSRILINSHHRELGNPFIQI